MINASYHYEQWAPFNFTLIIISSYNLFGYCTRAITAKDNQAIDEEGSSKWQIDNLIFDISDFAMLHYITQHSTCYKDDTKF